MSDLTFEALLKAFNAHDPDALAYLFTDDGVIEELGWGRTFDRGHVGDHIRFLLSFSSDFVVGYLSTTWEDGLHAAEWEFRGTQTGPVEELGIPATGRPITMRGAVFFTTESGLITTLHTYWSLVELLHQLGVPQQPGVESGLARWSEEAWGRHE